MFCPNPAMPLWSSHPRVFLDIADDGEAMCPYCGTRYVLAGGPLTGAALAVRVGALRASRRARSCPQRRWTATHPDRRAVLGRRRDPLRAAGRAAARAVLEDPIVDVLVAVVVRAGVRAHARHPPHHREPDRARQRFDLASAALARAELRERRLHACVRAARFVEVGAGAVSRAHPASASGYIGRSALRAADRRAARSTRRRMPRLVDRFAALAGAARQPRADAAVAGARARHGQSRRRDARAAAEDRPAGGDPVSRAPNTARPSAGRRTSSPNSPRRFLRDGHAGVDRRLAQRQDRHRRGRCNSLGDTRARCATSPAAPTSAPRSTCCRRRRSSSATIRASCTRPRRSACRWSRCSARRRRSTRRRCRRRADREDRHRVQPLLQARMSARALQVHARIEARDGLPRSPASAICRTDFTMAKARTHPDLHDAAGRGARVLPGVRGAGHRRDDGHVGRRRGHRVRASGRRAAGRLRRGPQRVGAAVRRRHAALVSGWSRSSWWRRSASRCRAPIEHVHSPTARRAAPRSPPTCSCARRRDGGSSAITRRRHHPRRSRRPPALCTRGKAPVGPGSAYQSRRATLTLDGAPRCWIYDPSSTTRS